MILDGRKARRVRAKQLKEAMNGLRVRLAILQVGDLAESNAYIGQKVKFAEEIGVAIERLRFPENVREEDLVETIHGLNANTSIHGIIVQMPIPAHLAKQRIINSIVPHKDVDGLTDVNILKLAKGDAGGHIPAMARGVIELLQFYNIDPEGTKVAVLGRSALVGAPTAQLLKNKGAEVTVCHSQTPNTKEVTRESDIVIVAIGKPRFIGNDYIRQGHIVVDVGITAVSEKGESKLEEEIAEKKLVGDVDFEAVKDKVAAISPVPGGVGPMTVLALFENLLDATKRVPM